jgi:putative transposase
LKSPFKIFLRNNVQSNEIELFRKHERTGRPMGSSYFIGNPEQLLGRDLKPQKPEPKGIRK